MELPKGGKVEPTERQLGYYSLAAIRVALCPWVIKAIIRGSGVFLLKCRISGSLCRFVNYYMMKQIHTLLGKTTPCNEPAVWGAGRRNLGVAMGTVILSETALGIASEELPSQGCLLGT